MYTFKYTDQASEYIAKAMSDTNIYGPGPQGICLCLYFVLKILAASRLNQLTMCNSCQKFSIPKT